MSESFIDLKCNKSCRHDRELEQQLSELKESQKQKQIIRLCNRLDKAEHQNEQMLEALIMIYKVWYEDSILISSTKPIIESVTGKPIDEY